MSSSSTGGDAMRRVGGEASLPVSPCMEGVLPIRGVDGSTGEAIPIDVTPSLRRADDPYMADVVRWVAMDVPSIMVEEDLTKLREAYRIPDDINLFFRDQTNELAFRFPRRGCTSLHLNAFVSGIHLPLHPMLRRILRAYNLAPTQVAPNGWSQMRVFDDPKSDLDVPSVYGIANLLLRCELSGDIVDVMRSIYQAYQKSRSYELILNRHRCLLKWIKEDAPRPTLARLTKQRPKTLVPGSVEDTSQRKAIEDLSRERNKEAVEASKVIEVDDTPEVEVPLSRKKKARATRTGTSQARGSAVETLTSGDGDSGPFDSKRRFRELIGAPGARIPGDALWNLPFYPSMGAQAMKKYFTPKWEEFSAHGELEDVLEASLASAIRASAMQLKVLGEFRTRMQEQKKLIAEASKSDKEHK
ncbi:putative abhydrolase domain-containing protein [Abeliophyllum distichum]|uniref:Abhydrolase domain-containing protein n=1 Tax=Abeliophyllum distichum TaxID=126358 RepID=A0ABD1S8U1_9LAMI